jgi:hypothetical protein
MPYAGSLPKNAFVHAPPFVTVSVIQLDPVP